MLAPSRSTLALCLTLQPGRKQLEDPKQYTLGQTSGSLIALHAPGDGRALAALLLLTTLVVGEVADARHHLSEHSCPADRGGRDDQCTCASLHVTSLASEPVTPVTPVECESVAAFVAVAIGPRTPVACAAAPRAPPRG